MESRTANGFMLSAALHGLVVALLVFGYFIGQQSSEEMPHVLQMVAGEGDNYAATAAPALGTPGGATVSMPKIAAPAIPIPKIAPPEPEPQPAEASPVEPAPPVVERAPAPKPAAVVTKAPVEEPIRNFTKDITRISTKRKNRLEAKYKAQQEAEERRAREAARRAAKEAELKDKRMTKAEFDAQNRREASAKSARPSSTKVSHIDAEGIAKGVVGGSTANKIGGASGKALSRDEGDVLDAYFAYLKQRLYEALEKPPGLSDTLVALAEMRIGADGTLSGARIVRSSGSADFDRAALDAIARVRSIGPRPDGKSEVIQLSFKMREEDDN